MPEAARNIRWTDPKSQAPETYLLRAAGGIDPRRLGSLPAGTTREVSCGDRAGSLPDPGGLNRPPESGVKEPQAGGA